MYSFLAEFFGWMLICAASIAASLLYIASVIANEPNSWTTWTLWFLIWLGMAFASLIRTYDLYVIARRHR